MVSIKGFEPLQTRSQAECTTKLCYIERKENISSVFMLDQT